MSEGSVKVGSGYYNADGINIITFENPIEKTLSSAAGTLGYKNNVVITLDNSGVSSFVLQGVAEGLPTGYKVTKALDKFVYLNNNKDVILGDSYIGGFDVKRFTFDIEGSPTITSEYVTGFSDTNRLTIKDYLLDTTSSFEVAASFSLDSSPASNCAILDKKQENSTTSFRLEVNSSNKLSCRLSNAVGSATYFATLTGTTTLSLNTRYWVKVVYSSSSGYTLQLSTNGVNYTTEARTTVTTLIGKTSTTYLIIGDNSATGSNFPGKIYLNAFRIYVNGNLVWSLSLNSLYVSKGYAYVDETLGSLELSNASEYTSQEIIVHPEDFEGSTTKIAYMSLVNTSGTLKPIVTGMRNPTKEYTGSVITPIDLAKKITFSSDFSEILTVEDI